MRAVVVELRATGDSSAAISSPNDAVVLLRVFQSILREESVVLPRAFLMAAAISAPVAKRFSRSFSSAFITMEDTDCGMASSGLSRAAAWGEF